MVNKASDPLIGAASAPTITIEPIALDVAARRLARARSILNRTQREYDEARALARDKERALCEARRAYDAASVVMIRSAEAADQE